MVVKIDGIADNVEFDHGFFRPCQTDFSAAPSFQVVSGTWTVANGTLNSTAAGQSDLANLNCSGNLVGEDAGTNQVYSARVMNQYAASGNLVGLVYNYQDGNSLYAGDY